MTTAYPVVHGTQYGSQRCTEAAGYACQRCTAARRDAERARNIRRGGQLALDVPMETLAALLAAPAGVALISELGPRTCSRITAAADEHGSPEYRRLRSVGVNPHSAALLAQYHNKGVTS